MLWRLNGRVINGTGSEALLANLPGGDYELSLTATDSAGLSTTATTDFRVVTTLAPQGSVIDLLLGRISNSGRYEFDHNDDGIIDSADIEKPQP